MEMVSLTGWVAAKRGRPAGRFTGIFPPPPWWGRRCIPMAGTLTEGTLAGIKVVVAIAVLEPGGHARGAR